MKNKKIIILSSFLILFLGFLFIFQKVTNASSITVSVWADNTTVSYNGSTTIHWSSTGADYCSGGNTTATSGSFSTGSLASSSTFSITCYNSYHCRGTSVKGSTSCDGSTGMGSDEGASCSSFTTEEACEPSNCSSWFHHGCSWGK